MDPNKNGLRRYIEAPIRYEIRKNSGFGCVKCGNAICDYHHVDPTFENAKTHDPNCITLLCGSCHVAFERGFLSKTAVLKAIANPYAFQHGYSHEMLDVGGELPTIYFAGSIFYNCYCPILVGDKPILTFNAPEYKGGNYRLSAKFYNERGINSLKIIDNEYFVNSTNWDVELKAGNLIIRDQKGVIHLRLKMENQDMLIIDRMRMRSKFKLFEGNANELKVIDVRTGVPSILFADNIGHSSSGAPFVFPE